MRNILLAAAFSVSMLSVTDVCAQANIGCMDKSIRLQSEQVKHDFKAQGMFVYKDAMVSMVSKEPFPIAVQLNKGELYQLVFIGNKQANNMTFELFDGTDKKIGEKTADNPEQSNIIIYSFVPEKTDVYLVVLSQKIKYKSVCSSFCILQKGEAPAQQSNTTPNSNTQYSNDNPYPLKRGKNIEKK